MLQMIMSKLSLKVYLVCGYAILALLFLPAPVFASSNCAKNPKTCTYSHLCAFATKVNFYHPTQALEWADGKWSGHVKEAKRRGFSCKVKTYDIVKSTYNAFMNLSDEERKELQSKLKEINLYSSGIDGLYGKGTQTSLIKFINENLKLSDVNDSSVKLAIEKLLSKSNPSENPETVNENIEAQIAKNNEQEAVYDDAIDKKPLVITEELMQQRLVDGDFQSAVLAAKILAPKGSSSAQFVLGSAYAEGVGVLQQFKLAHMWLNIASLNGSSQAVEIRNNVQKQMTPEAVMQAKEHALKCIQSEYNNCGMITSGSTESLEQADVKSLNAKDLKEEFLSTPKLRRQQIQFALKDLGLYASSVDGKWGIGTERGLKNFLKLSDQDLSSADKLFTNLISKVDVPSSFVEKQPKKVQSAAKVSSKPVEQKPSFRAPSGWRAFENVSHSFAQADAICRPQARNAGIGTKAAPMYGTTQTNCNAFGTGFSCNSDPSGLQGFANAMASLGAEKNAYNGCMAQYGWKRTKKQGLFEK